MYIIAKVNCEYCTKIVIFVGRLDDFFRRSDKEGIKMDKEINENVKKTKKILQKIKKHLHRTLMYGVQRNREVFRMKYVKRTKPAGESWVRPFLQKNSQKQKRCVIIVISF